MKGPLNLDRGNEARAVATPSSAFPKPGCHDNVKDWVDGDGLGSPKFGDTAIGTEMVKALVV